MGNAGKNQQSVLHSLKPVVASLDLEAIARRTVTAALTLTGAEESCLLLLKEPGHRVYLWAQARYGLEQVKDMAAPLDSPLAMEVVRTGVPVVVMEAEKAGLWTARRTPPAYALVGLPLKARGVIIGVLEAVNYRQVSFGEQEQQLLSTLAEWAAIAVDHARLFRANQEYSYRLELAGSVMQLVCSSLDPEQIPRLLIERTAKIFGATTGSLALVDRTREGVIFQLAYDSQGRELKKLKNFLMPLGTGIVGVVAQTGVPRIVNDVQTEPAWSPLADRLTGFQTKNLMAAPLLSNGQVLGVIEILNKQEGGFEESDLHLLSVIAGSTAIAIQNAQEHTALKNANENLELLQGQRIASENWAILGKAAGNLAHRINNCTALIPAASQHLRELLANVSIRAELRQEVNANLDRIERNALYTVELASVLLHRFRNRPAKAHDVNRLVERALMLVDISPDIKVVSQLDPELPLVDTSDLIIDAFVELVSNAIQAMTPDGGLLRVASFRTGEDEVSVQITDSGPGIASENLDRVFDLFYTTSAHGLGFGLWWVKTFLEQQHGQIAVESRPGEGTTFTVTLPRRLPPLHSD